MQDLQVSVPSVQYYTVEEATKTLEDLGLEVKIKGEGDTVIKQVPSAVKIEQGGSVVLYTDSETKEETVTVPSLQGLTKEQAKATLDMYGLNLTAEGSGYEEEGAVAQSDQSISAGQSVQWERLLLLRSPQQQSARNDNSQLETTHSSYEIKRNDDYETL